MASSTLPLPVQPVAEVERAAEADAVAVAQQLLQRVEHLHFPLALQRPQAEDAGRLQLVRSRLRLAS
jgi:hypothetical protein